MPKPEDRPLTAADLRQRVLAAARAYHGALARYARALLSRAGLESAAQEVVGTSLRYHAALDSLIVQPTADPLLAAHLRLAKLRRQLEAASRQYDALRRCRAICSEALRPHG